MFPISSSNTESGKTNADFPLTVRQQLNCAQPAESARTPGVGPYSGGADYYYLHSMKPQSDGLWLCCCGADNELIHWTGPHPFKRLKCEKCENVLCRNCDTAQILTPCDENAKVASDHNGLRLAQVCPSCGPSHRACDFRGSTWDWASTKACYCGERPHSNWLQYTMKAPGMYKVDPTKVAQDMKIARLEKMQSSGKHNSAQKAPARCLPSINEHRVPLSHRPGLRSLQTSNVTSNTRGSILRTPISLLGPAAIVPQKALTHLSTKRPQISLKRSGAVRNKQHSPYAGQLASYQLSHLSARPTLVETRGPIINYGALRDEAKAYLKSILGDQVYEDIEDSVEGEKMIWEVIHDNLLPSVLETKQFDTEEEAQLVRNLTTFDQLLHSAEEVPRRRVSRAVTDLPSLPPPQEMTAECMGFGDSEVSNLTSGHVSRESAGMYGDLAIAGGVALAEDDWAGTWKLYQRSLGRKF